MVAMVWVVGVGAGDFKRKGEAADTGSERGRCFFQSLGGTMCVSITPNRENVGVYNENRNWTV